MQKPEKMGRGALVAGVTVGVHVAVEVHVHMSFPPPVVWGQPVAVTLAPAALLTTNELVLSSL